MLHAFSPRGKTGSFLSSLSLTPKGNESTSWKMIEVKVPPGPLGILLDGNEKTAAILEDFAPLSNGEKGFLEKNTDIIPGSILVSVNEFDFVASKMSMFEIGRILRDTSGIERHMRFKVPPTNLRSSDRLQLLADQITSSYSEETDSIKGAKKWFKYNTRSSTSSTSSPSPNTVVTLASTPNGSPTTCVQAMINTPTTEQIAKETATSIKSVVPLMKEITVSVPSGPLGLNLDGAVPHCARVTGFIPLPGGSKGALEKHGGILHGSVLVKINGEDFSTKSLAEITTKLGALVNQQRSLTFRLPSNIAINFNPSHSMCKFNMDPRRKEEMKLIMKYDSSKLNRKECWFLVDMSWMEKWVKFIGHGGPIPGVISNQNLLEPEWADRLEQKAPGRPDTPKQGLEVSKDYRAVTPMVWSLFVAFHGAGKAPLLGRYVVDLYAEPISDLEVQAILHEPRLKASILVEEANDRARI